MRRSILVITLPLLVACASAGPGAGRDRNVIKEDEIATIDAETAYDVVRRLRGEFLKSRGTVTRTTTKGPTQTHPSVTVFVDGTEAGPAERTLYLIPAREVQEIRLFRAADAATKYGSRHNGGVIEVTTRRHEP